MSAALGASGTSGTSGAAGTSGAPDAVPHARRGFALVVLGAVLWGTGGLAGAALADEGLGPGAVAALRLGAGGVALVAFLAVLARVPGGVRPGAVAWSSRPVLARLGAVAALLAAYQACYFSALGRTSVSVATLVALGAAPVLVALATAVRSRTLPEPRVLVAMLLALGGLVLLVRPGSGADGVVDPLGLLLALLAAAAFAGVTIVNRRPVPGLEPVVMTGASFVLGGVLLAPWALASGIAAGTGDAPDSGRVALLVVFLAVVPTAAAWAAYFTGLRWVPATTASLVALLEPLTASVGAAVLRGERIGLLGVLGAVALGAATFAVRPRTRNGTRLAYDGRRSASTVPPPGVSPTSGPTTGPPPPGAGL